MHTDNSVCAPNYILIHIYIYTYIYMHIYIYIYIYIYSAAVFSITTITTVVASDSCRRDSNLVALICCQCNVLSTLGGSVQVYRFSTDRGWFSCISMHCSWKRQILLCESAFRKVSWIAPRVVFFQTASQSYHFCPCRQMPLVCWCADRLRNTRFFSTTLHNSKRVSIRGK